MHALRTELTAGKAIPEIRAGDSVEVKMLPYKTAKSPMVMRGVCLGKVNRGIDTSIILRDYYQGEIIERQISVHAPLITEIKVLQRAFIHKGKKRVRRSKLYYLRDLDPMLCKVS